MRDATDHDELRRRYPPACGLATSCTKPNLEHPGFHFHLSRYFCRSNNACHKSNPNNKFRIVSPKAPEATQRPKPRQHPETSINIQQLTHCVAKNELGDTSSPRDRFPLPQASPVIRHTSNQDNDTP